jgi:hypothetical protein
LPRQFRVGLGARFEKQAPLAKTAQVEYELVPFRMPIRSNLQNWLFHAKIIAIPTIFVNEQICNGGFSIADVRKCNIYSNLPT